MITNQDLNTQYNTFCNNIRYYRKVKNITQEELAEKAEVSISYIKQIESNREYKNVSLTVILKLCKALDITISDLFETDHTLEEYLIHS